MLGASSGFFNRYQVGPGGPLAPPTTLPTPAKLTYEDLQLRREEVKQQEMEREQAREQARRVGSAVMELGEGIDSGVANADTLGDSFRYTIEQKVNLPRHMSGLLPILNSPIQARSVSDFNKEIHPRFPLRGLRVKNDTGQNLVQGPVAVFEDGVYAGDTQILDMQSDQERLISYAMDLGLEVRDQRDTSFDTLTRLRLSKGVLTVATVERAATIYTLRNRSAQDRTLLLEHPITAEWTYAGAEKLVEKTKDFYRLEWTVPAGKTLAKEILEEREQMESKRRVDLPDATLKGYLTLGEGNKPVQDLLRLVLEKRAKLVITQPG